MKVLVTGGSGYIGSHTCIELIKAGYEVVVVDSLYNSSIEPLKRIEKLYDCKIKFYQSDVRDEKGIRAIFNENIFEAVIHFAGLKAVGESVLNPIEYYNVNVGGAFNIIKIMNENNCKKFVFSSSATVYGKPKHVPIKEDSALMAANTYGRTKLMVEDFLRDISFSDNAWSIGILRYFNPVGAHHSGLIGEDPNEVPNNLMPYISQVAVGNLKKLNIFGNDYKTHDGTGVRDYIHVVDLAKGHVKTIKSLIGKPQLLTVNLGTGRGYSVFEIIKAFENASGKKIPYQIAARRAGDIDSYYADTNYAKESIGWEADLNLDQMCQDTWRWQSINPNGYK
jgi:UDP-glucose 4-epimerase